MKNIGEQFRRRHDTLAARIFLLIALGMVTAVIISLLAADHARRQDFARITLERVVASTEDIISRFQRAPVETQMMLAEGRIIGAHASPAGARPTATDQALTALLAKRLGASFHPTAGQAPVEACWDKEQNASGAVAAGLNGALRPQCWIVTFTDPNGVRRALAIDLPSLTLPRSAALSPIFLLIIVAAGAVLALLAARLAAAPIAHLSRAAQSFSLSSDPEPLPEHGPEEVRAALSTFNLMQSRIREGFRERTQLLAAISHDLQTPLTRLRLRLEQVEDEALRERLISDLAATQKLVREGLDLARSTESEEDPSTVYLDPLLQSVAEDASEFGDRVTFADGCGASVRVKPNALLRCLGNLIDNAVKYGGDAELRCFREEGQFVITVRDHGPGVPPDALETLFKPFVRGETSRSRTTGGTGIGLTIARAQARTFGGTVTLENHLQGGLVARVTIPA
ncbi:signal transduction histidine kinase [Rhizomicrobium palustre]|uniref:histidine kinase n=1 Tax=Rhizomicrobium palustre TaxID=189966 RepID=A0A846MTZ1_9PROT|nr:ATP-binding protein [Rhizomicrobium palustre]NIK86823.1 signal transduction histidine kinase [Rhizomicrobium palustre]